MTWRDRATNSAGRWAPPSVQKATDFDTILQEGLQALAKRVQEHHDYLVKVQPGQGRESWRNDRSSGHSHEQDTGLPPPLPLCASVSRSSKVSYCAPDADSDRSNPQQVQLDGRPEQGSSGLKPAPLPLRIPGIVSHEEPPEVAMNGYSDLEGADEEQEAEPVVVKHTFKLHEGWRSVQASAPHLKEAQAAVASAWFQVDATESDDEGSDSESSDSEVSQNPALAERCGRRFQTCLEPWMISPNSVFRSCWDSLACLFVVYECVMIPLAFFDFGESAVLDVIGWVVRLFWSMDFPLSCLTGYALAGDMLEMRPSKVLPHYAKTWMSLDVSMLAVDWAEVAIGGVGSLNAARMGKTVKSLRMIRMMRLWRLLNVSQMPEFVRVLIHHYFQSEVSRILLDIFKILVFLVWINHVLACCWYGVADSLEASDHSWIREARFQSSMIIHLYVTCFHWSLTQFAGSTDVFPSNVYERTFAVFALLFCFILSASIVSSITTSMTRLSIARSKETTKLTALKEYLRENHISSRTALRVQRNAQYAIEEQKRHTPEEDIELLGYLSEPLRVELRFEITMPVLRKHAFFNVLEQENPAFARQLCYKALTTIMLSRADILFIQGVDSAHQMFFFTDGKLSYFKDALVQSPKSPARKMIPLNVINDKTTVGPGDWASEASLWTAWKHCGTMRAKSQCSVISLSAEHLQQIAGHFKDAVPYLRGYGSRFMKVLNMKAAEELTDLYDQEYEASWMARESVKASEQQEGGIPTLRRGASNLAGLFSAVPGGSHDDRASWLDGFKFLGLAARGRGGSARSARADSEVMAVESESSG